MQILYFNNGSGLGSAKSGGTARFIETAKRLQSKGVKITVVTTSGSIKLFNAESFFVDFFKVRSSIFSKKERSNYGRSLSYIFSTVHSIVISNKLPLCDVVYSPSDYFCDVVPSVYYKIKKKQVKYISMIHHICRPPSKRSGNFFLNAISYYAQKISYGLVAKFSDHILVYDTPEGEEVKIYFESKGFDPEKITFVANGVGFEKINNIKKSRKIPDFDVCFVGGLRGSKGIYDIISIWKLVVKSIPNAKISIIGEGIDSVTKKVRREILDCDLSDNIKLLGPISGDALYREMKNSRLFVSTSHEEGWGISVCEAMACGLPVIAYKLPAFGYLNNHIIKIDKYNHRDFCMNIVGLLNNKIQAGTLSNNGKEYIKKFDWNVISDHEYKVIVEVVNAQVV